MKYLKLFEKDEDAIYNRTSDTLYDAPGVAYIIDVDKIIYAPFDLNQKYYIDENYNAVLYRESYIDIVNNSETINVTDISSPIVKTINFTFENITADVYHDYHAYLTMMYGDYMKIPNPEQIRREQHADVWDTEKDYNEYLTTKPSLSAKYVL